MAFVFLRGSLKVQYILHASLSGRNSSNWTDRDQLPKFLLQGFSAEQSDKETVQVSVLAKGIWWWNLKGSFYFLLSLIPK